MPVVVDFEALLWEIPLSGAGFGEWNWICFLVKARLVTMLNARFVSVLKSNAISHKLFLTKSLEMSLKWFVSLLRMLVLAWERGWGRRLRGFTS